MKNHKAPLFNWILINFFLYVVVHKTVLEIDSTIFSNGIQGNSFWQLLSVAVYVYFLCFYWEKLQAQTNSADEFNSPPSKKNTVFDILDGFAESVIENTPIILLICGVFLTVGRLFFGTLTWLAKGEGEWFNESTCSVLGIFCSPDTRMIGLNKILVWLGGADYSLVALPLFAILFFMAKRHKKIRNK